MGSSLDTLEDVFEHEAQDLYSAETQLLEALPKMAAAATNPELKKSFEKHLEETRTQIERLQKAFEGEFELEGETCIGMQGLIAEGEKVIESPGSPEAKDAALIASAQKVEHYEMATYGTVRAFAEQLGKKQIAQRLQTTLNQEGKTDEKLTKLAESVINKQAAK